MICSTGVHPSATRETGCNRYDHLATVTCIVDSQRPRAITGSAETWSEAKPSTTCGQCRKLGDVCPACRIRAGDVPPVGGRKVVRRSADPLGFMRGRGRGRMGTPKKAEVDDQDLAYAIDSLVKGRAAVAYARSDQVKQLGAAQRREALQAAVAHLQLCYRFMAEVILRGGGELPELAE